LALQRVDIFKRGIIGRLSAYWHSSALNAGHPAGSCGFY
jgi:hypothetical protein